MLVKISFIPAHAHIYMSIVVKFGKGLVWRKKNGAKYVMFRDDHNRNQQQFRVTKFFSLKWLTTERKKASQLNQNKSSYNCIANVKHAYDRVKDCDGEKKQKTAHHHQHIDYDR